MPYVKFIKPITIQSAHMEFAHAEGDVVFLDERRAEHYISRGFCEPCAPPPSKPLELDPAAFYREKSDVDTYRPRGRRRNP